MSTSSWQKQHLHFQRYVWGASAVLSLILISILLALGYSIEVAGTIFILVFVLLRVSLAFIFNNRYANSMVRVLKFDYEELERDFRIVFKNESIRFFRRSEEDAYLYEFPGYKLNMVAEPYWLPIDINPKPVTKVTLKVVTAENREFAERLAAAIDEMAAGRAKS